MTIRRYAASPMAVPAVVALTGVALTIIATATIHRSEVGTADRGMDRRTESAQHAITTEARRHVDAVRAVAAALSSQQAIGHQGFVTATAALSEMALGGTTAAALIVPATDAEVPATQEYWRARGADGLQLRPSGPAGEHLFIIYQRNLSETTPAVPVGVDLSQSTEATQALRVAREQRNVAVSDTYLLLRDRALPEAQRQHSFAIAAPVYESGTPGAEPLLGWLVIGLRGQDFLSGILDSAAQGVLDLSLSTRRSDGTRVEVSRLRQANSHEPDLYRQVPIAVAQQEWTLRTQVHRTALPGGETLLDDGMAIGGTVVTLLGAALAFMLSTSRSRAQAEVHRATEQLRDAEREASQHAQLLSSVLDAISDGVAVIDDQERYLVNNPAAERLLGVRSTDAGIGAWQEHYGVYDGDGVGRFPAERRPLVRALQGESVDHVEMLIRNPERPAGVSLSVSARPLRLLDGRPGAVAVFHDVTARREAMAQVQESEERLRLLLDGARDYAIYLLDVEGRFSSWSPSLQRSTGYSEADLIGRPFDVLFPPEDRAAGVPTAILHRASEQGGEVHDGEWVRNDGSRYWTFSTVTARTAEDGSVTGFVVVSHDETDRHRADAKFRGLLEAAPEAMLGVAPDGRILLVNTRAEELFGYQRAELLGRSVDELVPEGVRARHRANRDRYIADPVPRPMGENLELAARRADGTIFPAEISLSSFDSEEGMIVSAAIRDISERKQAQRDLTDLNHQLRTVNDELERRVQERTARLEEQATVLRNVNAELESFSYSVSHDLRAPLRAVSGFATIVSEEYGDRLDDGGRRYLTKVQAGAEQMGQLIDGLLAFSRLQRQDLNVRPVAVAEVVADVWEELAPDREGRVVELTVDHLPACQADPRLIRHVIANLLGNAVKYTKGRDVARVRIGGVENDQGHIEYHVRDNGTGFDMRYADKLFKVFQRLHRAEDYEGTGIGLALVARIVRRHGGDVWAHAEPGVGATFSFSLPRAEDPHHGSDPGTGDGTAGRGQPERPGALAARA